MKNKVKGARVVLGITQATLAKKVGVSRQTINAIESGNYNLSTALALKIAFMFEKSIHELFELEVSDWENK